WSAWRGMMPSGGHVITVSSLPSARAESGGLFQLVRPGGLPSCATHTPDRLRQQRTSRFGRPTQTPRPRGGAAPPFYGESRPTQRSRGQPSTLVRLSARGQERLDEVRQSDATS